VIALGYWQVKLRARIGWRTVMQVESMQFSQLKDIRDVTPLSDKDNALMADLATVLRNHDAIDRFSVSLMHSHFPVADHEMLVETCDVEGRTLMIKPVPKSDLDGLDYITTSWHLGSGKPQMACVCVKFGNDHQHHSRG
jgi:hypothetical protein